MANPKGVGRLRKLAKILVRVGWSFLLVGALVVGAVYVQALTMPHQVQPPDHPLPWLLRHQFIFLLVGQPVLLYLGLLPLALGYAVRVAAWIVEGFMQPVRLD